MLFLCGIRSMHPQAATQIKNLEQQNTLLTRIVIVLVIASGSVSGLISLSFICFILIFPVLAIAHQRLPEVARNCGRLISYAFGPISSTK